MSGQVCKKDILVHIRATGVDPRAILDIGGRRISLIELASQERVSDPTKQGGEDQNVTSKDIEIFLKKNKLKPECYSSLLFNERYGFQIKIKSAKMESINALIEQPKITGAYVLQSGVVGAFRDFYFERAISGRKTYYKTYNHSHWPVDTKRAVLLSMRRFIAMKIERGIKVTDEEIRNVEEMLIDYFGKQIPFSRFLSDHRILLQTDFQGQIAGLKTKKLLQKLHTLKAGRPDVRLPILALYQIMSIREELIRRGVRPEKILEPLSVIQGRLYPNYGDRIAWLSSGDRDQNGYFRHTYGSLTGFLRRGTDLATVINKDKLLLKKKGYSVRHIAEPLLLIEQGWHRGLSEFRVTYNGRTFRVEARSPVEDVFNGSQGCPFFDLTRNNHTDFEITDIQTGRKFNLFGMMPHLIAVHGFFENTRYRLEPQSIIDFFRIKPDLKK